MKAYPAAWRSRGWRAGAAAALLVISLAPAPARAQSDETVPAGNGARLTTVSEELRATAVRLPLAAVLGTILALRPRRRSTPPRQMSVIETQIILAMVGALVMLVVGASLARAFGIVGAANLIRYRAKVDDPKDAVVMLSALGVGLASGVGLYALASGGTLLIGAALWTIEGFEPAVRKRFELTVGAKDGVVELRPRIEGILRRFKAQYELRASAPESVSYEVAAPEDLRVDHVSRAIADLGPAEDISVEWDQHKSK